MIIKYGGRIPFISSTGGVLAAGAAATGNTIQTQICKLATQFSQANSMQIRYEVYINITLILTVSLIDQICCLSGSYHEQD